MARQLDDRQLAELASFVNDLAEAVGYTTTAEWARESGYAYANLVNLRNGKKAVDGYNLLKLIRAAAARAEMSPGEIAVGQAREAGSVAAQRIERRLEGLEATVAELPTADDLGRAVSTMQAAIDRLASRDTREVQPVKPARRRGAGGR